MLKGVLILVLGVISSIFSGWSIQQHLLYCPDPMIIDDVRLYAEQSGLQLWPEDGAAYRGLVSSRGPADHKGTVIVFHGNAGAAVHRAYYTAALGMRGYRVVLAEYPGYGGRSGELSEKSFVADARLTAKLARKDFGGPLFIWGESMGCGVASALASDRDLGARGVVMLTPWDTLLNEAKAKFPWLPVKLLMRDKYDNVANLAGCDGPVAVIMAKRDEIIPNRLTRRLYESLSQPKQLWVFEKAGHNDWPTDPGNGWWDEVMEFVNSRGTDDRASDNP
jgi:pimeloyl-ACP methyl ester carboxylesterase